MNFSFTNQVEENVGFALQYPFHMNCDALTEKSVIVYPEKQIEPTFEALLYKAYKEPFAIYLTDEDRKSYSEQELTLFDKMIAFEQDRINRGMCKIDLDIDDNTMEVILEYRTAHHMTFEEAITSLLTKFVNYMRERDGNNGEEHDTCNT